MTTGWVMGKLFDWPPVWLGLALAVTWGFNAVMPWGLFGPGGRPVGAVLALAGLGLMAAAVGQMGRARTTVIPRRAPRALVTGGVFRLSRNPIYLGDALILAGAILWWDVPVAVPILLVFILTIQHRFILPEEAALRRMFGADYETWAARTGRWIGGLPF